MTSYKKIGIYIIKNAINNKMYIGQSVDIGRRWRQHQRELNEGVHRNKHLQRAWDCYGETNFIFDILELCDKNELNDKELFYINKYNSNDYNCGYNICGGGDSVHTFADETKRKLSEIMQGKNNWKSETYALVSGNNHWSRKNPDRFFELNGTYPIQVYCPEYDIVFNSMNDGAKYSGVNKSNIAKVVRGERFTAGKHKDTGMPLHWYPVDQFLLDRLKMCDTLEVAV